MGQPKFKIKVNRQGYYYFELYAGNGQMLVKSEYYSSKSACENGIASVQRCAPIAEVVEG